MRGALHLGTVLTFTNVPFVAEITWSTVAVEESGFPVTIVPVTETPFLRTRPGPGPVSVSIPVIVEASTTASVPVAATTASAAPATKSTTI